MKSLLKRIAKIEQFRATDAESNAQIEKELARLRALPDGQQRIDEVIAEIRGLAATGQPAVQPYSGTTYAGRTTPSIGLRSQTNGLG